MFRDTRTEAPQGVPHLLLMGLDSLYVSYFLETVSSSIPWEDLAYKRERLRHARKAKLAELTLGSESFALMPYGAFPYTYVLKNKGMEVRLAEVMQPTFHVRFSSEGLWQEGVDSLTTRFEDWCSSMDLRTLRPETVSRADWAFDFHLPNIDFTEDHFVTRFKKDGKWRGNQKLETLQFGTGDLVLRLYDKSKEIAQASDKTWFYDLWGRKDDVWRIEWQTRSERLKTGDIRSLGSLGDFQADLLREIATKHTTLRRPTADSNRHRWPLHPLWIALQTAIEALPQYGLVKAIDPETVLERRLHNQLNHIYAGLKGYAALLQSLEQREDGPDLPETLMQLTNALSAPSYMRPWKDDLERKFTALRFGQW